MRAKPSRLDDPQIKALRVGAECFNQGLFFQAHEGWEIRWRKLPVPDQPQVQAAILACGFFVLIKKGRFEPALRLAQLSIDRFAEVATQAALNRTLPALELPELEDRVLRIVARIRLGEKDSSLLLSETQGLRARVNLENLDALP